MTDDRDARRRRAAAREEHLEGGLVGREEDLPPTADTPLGRLELLAEISARAWALGGEPIPTWTRETMPGRLSRRQPR